MPDLARIPQRVAVVAIVGEEDLAFAETGEHVGRLRPSAELLASGPPLEQNGQAVGVDEGMDLVVSPPRERPGEAGSSEKS